MDVIETFNGGRRPSVPCPVDLDLTLTFTSDSNNVLHTLDALARGPNWQGCQVVERDPEVPAWVTQAANRGRNDIRLKRACLIRADDGGGNAGEDNETMSIAGSEMTVNLRK